MKKERYIWLAEVMECIPYEASELLRREAFRTKKQAIEWCIAQDWPASSLTGEWSAAVIDSVETFPDGTATHCLHITQMQPW